MKLIRDVPVDEQPARIEAAIDLRIEALRDNPGLVTVMPGPGQLVVLRAMNEHGPMSVADICRVVGERTVQPVISRLAGLAVRGLVERTGDGRWRAIPKAKAVA